MWALRRCFVKTHGSTVKNLFIRLILLIALLLIDLLLWIIVVNRFRNYIDFLNGDWHLLLSWGFYLLNGNLIHITVLISEIHFGFLWLPWLLLWLHALLYLFLSQTKILFFIWAIILLHYWFLMSLPL